MNFALDASQADSVREAVVKYCKEDDIAKAYLRYPGERPAGEFPQPGQKIRLLIEEYSRVIGLESGYFSSSFLLRVLEQKWADASSADCAALRREVILGAPDLVRPSLDVAARVDLIAKALTDMLARLPAQPKRGSIGDVVVFDRFCRGRDAIRRLSVVLHGLGALKLVQDHLMMLRVQGAPWLVLDDGAAPPLEPFIVLVELAGQAAAGAIGKLPEDVEDAIRQCGEAFGTAAVQLRDAAAAMPAQLPAILDMIGGLLARTIRQVQEAMFVISRDLPLKTFRGLFAGQDDVVCAVIDLCDTMRRRLMQYWLFEQADEHIGHLRDIVLDPDPAAWVGFQTHYAIVDVNLRGLLASGAGPAPLFSPFADAMASTDLRAGKPETDAERVAHATLLAALDDLRDGTMAAALRLDQQLRVEVSHLQKLQPLLDDILKRLPFNCDAMVLQ